MEEPLKSIQQQALRITFIIVIVLDIMMLLMADDPTHMLLQLLLLLAGAGLLIWLSTDADKRIVLGLAVFRLLMVTVIYLNSNTSPYIPFIVYLELIVLCGLLAERCKLSVFTTATGLAVLVIGIQHFAPVQAVLMAVTYGLVAVLLHTIRTGVSVALAALQQREDTLGREIANRQHITESLRASENRYRQLLDMVEIGITVNSLDELKYLYCNPRAVALLSRTYGTDEIVGKTVDEIDIAENARTALEGTREIRVQRRLGPQGYQLPTPDGNLYVEMSSILIEYEGQEAVLSLLNDVTEEKQMQERLKQSVQRYHQLLNLIPVGVVMISLETMETLYANTQTARILGYASPNDLINANFMLRLTSEAAVELGKIMPALTKTSVETIPQCLIRQVDGTLIDVEIRAVRTEFATDDVILLVFNDIRAILHLREQAIQNEILRVELETNRQILHLKDNFISLMSHQFRTPLTIALSSKEILQTYYDRLTPERRDNHFAKIDSAIHQMLRILEDVLLLSMIAAGTVEVDKRLTNLKQLCQNVISTFESDRIILITTDDTWPDSLLDSELIRHILENLLDNALRYSPLESNVNVDLNHDDDTIQMIVCDEGIGIPEAEQKMLYEPFFRASNVPDYQGTGLGLPVVRNAVDLHGGTITVQSQPGKGTTFTITLPLEFPNPPETR